jgi:hypothetical protein
MPGIYGQSGETGVAGSPGQFGRVSGQARTPCQAPAECPLGSWPVGKAAGLRG